MGKLSAKDVSASISGGYVHIILPDIGEPTGFKSYRIKLEDFTSGAPAASAVSTNTTNFDGNLSSSDDTVQKALDTLDEMIASGTDELVKYDAGDTTAGYLGAKIVAGTGISIAEGTGGDENKVKITNTVSISGLLDETAHDLLDHTGLTGIPSISGLLDETAHDLLDHTGLTGVGSGDMVLASVQSVTGEKVFDSTKASVKGSSTGKNIIAAANSSATDYTNTLPAKTGTFAMTSDIPAADVTIGTGGDYADIAAAQTAGKYRLLAVGAITMGGDTTLTNAMSLDLNGQTLACGNYTFTKGTGGSLAITCNKTVGNITFAFDSGKALFNTFSLTTLRIYDIGTITNSSSANGTTISSAGYFSNLSVVIPNKTYGGFGINTAAFTGIVTNVNMTINAANSTPIYSTDVGTTRFTNLNFSGTGFSLMLIGNATNIVSTCTGQLWLYNGNHIIHSSGTLSCTGKIIDFTAKTLSSISGKMIHGTVTDALGFSNTNGSTLIDITFSSTLTFTNSYNMIVDQCRITGMLTLQTSSYNITITNNVLTAGYTDTTGVTSNVIMNNR